MPRAWWAPGFYELPEQRFTPNPHPCRLCKIKYYNNCLFYNVQRNFIAQSGDPTNSGKGGESIWGVLYGEQVGVLGGTEA